MINNLSEALAFIKKSKLKRAATQSNPTVGPSSPDKKSKPTPIEDDFFAFPEDPIPQKVDILSKSVNVVNKFSSASISSCKQSSPESKKSLLNSLEFEDFDEAITSIPDSPLRITVLKSSENFFLIDSPLSKNENFNNDQNQKIQTSLDRLRSNFGFGTSKASSLKNSATSSTQLDKNTEKIGSSKNPIVSNLTEPSQVVHISDPQFVSPPSIQNSTLDQKPPPISNLKKIPRDRKATPQLPIFSKQEIKSSKTITKPTYQIQIATPSETNLNTQNDSHIATIQPRTSNSNKARSPISTSSLSTVPSRKRPPGPAGYYTRVQPGEIKKCGPMGGKEVRGKFFFKTTSWPLFLRYHDLKEYLEWDKKPVSCIISSKLKAPLSIRPVSSVLQGTFNTKLRVPALALTVVRVIEQDLHAQVLFADPSGEISGSVSLQIFHKNLQFIEPGVVWVLKDVSLICPDNKTYHINVVASNLLQIFPINRSPYEEFSNYAPIIFKQKVHQSTETQPPLKDPVSSGSMPIGGDPEKVTNDPISQLLSQNILDDFSDDFSD